MTEIEEGAFSGCKSLTSITIPHSVTLIGNYAFSDCTGLTDIYFSGSESEWSKVKIRNFNVPLTYATIHYDSEISEASVEQSKNITESKAESENSEDTAEKKNTDTGINTTMIVTIVVLLVVFGIGIAVIVMLVLKQKK